jgi:hypothetical protein
MSRVALETIDYLALFGNKVVPVAYKKDIEDFVNDRLIQYGIEYVLCYIVNERECKNVDDIISVLAECCAKIELPVMFKQTKYKGHDIVEMERVCHE